MKTFHKLKLHLLLIVSVCEHILTPGETFFNAVITWELTSGFLHGFVFFLHGVFLCMAQDMSYAIHVLPLKA